MKRLSWCEGIYAVLDFETTGVDVENDRAIQAALIFEAPGGYILPGSLVTYIHPGEGLEMLTEEATKVHGITKDKLETEGVASKEVFEQLHRSISAAYALDIPLVIYNAPFDWRLLHFELLRHGLPSVPPVKIIDPLLLDYHVDKYRKGSRKLCAVSQHYGVELENAHDAAADGVATGEVLRRIFKSYSRFKSYTAEEFHDLQAKWFIKWRDDRNAYWASQGKDARIDHGWPGI